MCQGWIASSKPAAGAARGKPRSCTSRPSEEHRQQGGRERREAQRELVPRLGRGAGGRAPGGRGWCAPRGCRARGWSACGSTRACRSRAPASNSRRFASARVGLTVPTIAWRTLQASSHQTPLVGEGPAQRRRRARRRRAGAPGGRRRAAAWRGASPRAARARPGPRSPVVASSSAESAAFRAAAHQVATRMMWMRLWPSRGIERRLPGQAPRRIRAEQVGYQHDEPGREATSASGAGWSRAGRAGG